MNTLMHIETYPVPAQFIKDLKLKLGKDNSYWSAYDLLCDKAGISFNTGPEDGRFFPGAKQNGNEIPLSCPENGYETIEAARHEIIHKTIYKILALY